MILGQAPAAVLAGLAMALRMTPLGGISPDEKARMMIMVIGSLTVAPEALAAVMAASLEHVHRSRREPGCISHAVHRDAENPNRLVFVEEWADMAALQVHFAVPASNSFAALMSKHAIEGPEIAIFDANLVRRIGGRK